MQGDLDLEKKFKSPPVGDLKTVVVLEKKGFLVSWVVLDFNCQGFGSEVVFSWVKMELWVYWYWGWLG